MCYVSLKDVYIEKLIDNFGFYRYYWYKWLGDIVCPDFLSLDVGYKYYFFG